MPYPSPCRPNRGRVTCFCATHPGFLAFSLLNRGSAANVGVIRPSEAQALACPSGRNMSPSREPSPGTQSRPGLSYHSHAAFDPAVSTASSIILEARSTAAAEGLPEALATRAPPGGRPPAPHRSPRWRLRTCSVSRTSPRRSRRTPPRRA